MQWRWYFSLTIVVAHHIACHQLGEQDQTYLEASSYSHPPWDALPDPDATGNLIFQSVNALLKQWPNTRYRNGHTIIPATIPPGTVLYHGRSDGNIPKTPEWVATDPEHSYLLCFTGVCQLMTFVTTRELRLLYFDGASAAKLPNGPLHSQDILFWGGVNEDKVFEEVERIADACTWGKPYGIDGYVRTQMDFEVMLCDFSNGLHLVSNSNIMPPSKPTGDPGPNTPPYPDPKLPVGWKGSPRACASIFFEAVQSGLWHSHPPGETRVRVHYSGMVSFFDPALSSLVEARRNQTRDEYRLTDISAQDIQDIRLQVEDVCTRQNKGSGIDWGSVVQVVVDRYAGRLQLVRYLLEHPGSRNVSEQATQVRSEVLTMLTPYMLTEVIPSSTSGTRSWIAPIAEHCASTLTSWAPAQLLTRQEKLIKNAIDEVLHEICRVLSDIWLDAFGAEEASAEETIGFLDKWTHDIQGLVEWLDWSLWSTCDPACGPEELCYLPTWPWVPGGWGWYPPDDEKGSGPRCISRVDPYSTFFDP